MTNLYNSEGQILQEMVICSEVFIEFGAFCVNVSLGMSNGSFTIVHSQTEGFSSAHILGLTQGTCNDIYTITERTVGSRLLSGR